MTEQELAGSGLRTFFRISEKWQMSPDQQGSLLGCEDLRVLDAYFADRDRAFRLIVTDVGGVVVRGV